LRKAGSLAKNVDKVYPGLIIDVDEMDDFQELAFHGEYPETARMEGSIMQFAQLAIGVSQLLVGQSTTERPVARETMALIQEMNKGIKQGIDNYRDDLGELGMRVIEMMAQYKPFYAYKIDDGETAFEDKAIDLAKLGYLRDAVKIELMASSEVLNTEIQREIDLTLYQLLSDYFTKVAGMLQAFPQVPPAVQEFITKIIGIGGKLMKRIVRDFGNVDADELVPDEDDINLQQMRMPPQQPRPPQGPPQGAPNVQRPTAPPAAAGGLPQIRR
jgi:hypothetical protein